MAIIRIASRLTAFAPASLVATGTAAQTVGIGLANVEPETAATAVKGAWTRLERKKRT